MPYFHYCSPAWSSAAPFRLHKVDKKVVDASNFLGRKDNYSIYNVIRHFGDRDAIFQVGQTRRIQNIEIKMALSRYEDFLHLGMNNLVDFLAVRGLNTSGRKIELIARAFSAFELHLPILESSEQQQTKLKLEYNKRLDHFKICDPLLIQQSERSDDISKWPKLDVGCIFSYILKVSRLIFKALNNLAPNYIYIYALKLIWLETVILITLEEQQKIISSFLQPIINLDWKRLPVEHQNSGMIYLHNYWK